MHAAEGPKPHGGFVMHAIGSLGHWKCIPTQGLGIESDCLAPRCPTSPKEG